MHAGEVQARDGDYFGACLNHVARLMSAAHGGQILVSEAVALECDELPSQASLINMGIHGLRDISRADNIYRLRHPALPDSFPPIKSERRRTGSWATYRSPSALAKLRDEDQPPPS